MSATDQGFGKIERGHIEQACQQLVGTAAKARGSYFVCYNGQELPAKAVVARAFHIANAREVSTKSFSGGQFVTRILVRFAFEVVVRGVSPSNADSGGNDE